MQGQSKRESGRSATLSSRVPTRRHHERLLPIPPVLRALLVTLALAALVAALPAAVLAQDQGTNQYQDPLAG